MSYRIGVDIGGTFTDLFAYNTTTGKSICVSSPSTPKNYAEGVMNVIDKTGIPYEDIEFIIHGTTVATNAIIMGNYAKTAFVTTHGMKDLVEIGRFHRKYLYDPYQTKPAPIVNRSNRFTVRERIDKSGEIIEPLHHEELISIANEIKTRGIKSIAIGFLNSYTNNVHEEKAKEILQKLLPGCYIVTSESILPSIGALGRFTTVIVNAALHELVGSYIESLQNKLNEKGFCGTLLMVQSNGGAITAEMVKVKPETLLMSGPAGGVIGALIAGDKSGEKDIITFDMGGTSSDISVIESGQPHMTTDFEIDWDMPIPIPLIEVLSIGAGGGSVAWIDPGGALKVGPKSAGAFPGPVCYGQGGVEPTVTDANLVLGYLDPKAFLSGDMKLDIEGAKEAISKLGEVLGLDMYQTAQGILEIVNQNMANAVKEITIGKGRDPRDFALSAFGGAGSLHAVSVSEKVGIPKVIVPLEPGNLCAFGDVNMNLQNEVGGFFYSKVQDVDIDALNKKFLEMDKEGEDSLDKQQVRCKAILTKHMISMRYVGQSYELEIPCPNSILQEQDITNLIADYHAEHKKIYFVADEESEVEITRLRATSVGIVMDPIDMEDLELVNKHSEDKSVMAMFDNSLLETKVFSRLNLLPGTKIAGPAIIRESKSSTVIPPGKACVVSKIDKSLIIEADKGGVYNG